MLGEPPDIAATAEKYGWVDEIEAWTVAVITGRSPADVIRIYGGAPQSPEGEYQFGQLAELGGEPENLRFHVQVVDLDGHVVALENNGWSGSHAEIARRCSADARSFFSVYWNVNGFGLLTEAVDGQITTRFEHLYPLAPIPEANEIRPDWALGDEVDLSIAPRVCMALMEQRTGVSIDPAWLGQQRPTYRIPEPYALFRDVEGADQP